MDGSSSYTFTMHALMDEVALLEVLLCLSVGSSIRASWIHIVCKHHATVSGVGVWGLLQRTVFHIIKKKWIWAQYHWWDLVISLSSKSSCALGSVSVLSDGMPLCHFLGMWLLHGMCGYPDSSGFQHSHTTP